ncbi:MAG: hypothetical protein EP335_05445 [Alphaproteobacteria bacterium]|nr:MAG: hypothetical protein EP335_05445 [Alphaproteobacteria bacterium]
MPREGDVDLRQLALIVIVVIIGLGLTWSATREAVHSAEAEAQARFESAAELYVDRIQGSLDVSMAAAGDLYRYYRAAGTVTREEFVRMVSSSSSLNVHRTLVGAVMSVRRDRIGQLEQYMSKVEGHPFRAYDPESTDGVQPEPSDPTDRGLYLVYVWTPDEAQEAAWAGLNIAAWPEVRTFLEETLLSDEPAAIPLPPLGHEISPGLGYVLLANPFLSRGGNKGLVVQVVDMASLVRAITENNRLSPLNLQLSSRWGGGSLSTGFTVRAGGQVSEMGGFSLRQPIWRMERTIKFGLQEWQVMPWAPLSAFRVDYGAAVITASVCLILTGLVVFIVWSQSQRAKRVVEIVNRRTRALKEAHEELEDHYKLLQNLNKDVEEARRAAEAANRAKSEFLATMSHELRTPLNAILGFSQILREQALGVLGDARYVEYAHDIHTSGSHLLSLINDILDLAKLEAGKINIERKVVDTRMLVDRVIALLAQQAESKGIEYKAEVADAMPEQIWGDELRLRQILINLASNAIKFTNVGSVVVRLHPKAFPNGQAGWVLEVQDTGIGIPEDKQATLFDRFTQVDTALSRRHGGVGLGLAICRELVDRMHGRISVRSIPGVGTTIRAHLPLEEAVGEDDDDNMMI